MTGRLVPRSDLTDADRAAMRSLLADHFDGVTPEQFDADLAGKNWAVLVEADAGELVGFSTLAVHGAIVDGERLTAVYSGDTIVAPAGLGRGGVPQDVDHGRVPVAAVPPPRPAALVAAKQRVPHVPVPCPCSGGRSTRDTTPPTPPAWQRVLDGLAGSRFGDRYDRTRGVVRLSHPNDSAEP